jgi:two-component system, NtrC family, sensor kinase
MKNGINEEPKNTNLNKESRKYSRLFRNFTALTIVCSMVPLLLVGWGMNIHYTKFAKTRMINSIQNRVEHHGKIINLFLEEHSSKLKLIAFTHSKDYLDDPAHLQHIFEMMNREHNVITDIGVIDENGRHMAYIGPYDLMDKNYYQAFWFTEAMEKGIYISDMFMGFRKEPHFIIAITRSEEGEKWILRATVNSQVFRSLVENVRIGKTGEVYLVNSDGIFQTSPRFSGNIMEKTPSPPGPYHDDVTVNIFKGSNPDSDFSNQITAETWLPNPQWKLVVKQDYSEAFADVNHANFATLIFLHLSALSILIVTIFITKYMISVIKRRDIQADNLNRQLMQTGKLASIGELAAGVAHEINNPLAIILTERQILLDLFGITKIDDAEFSKQLKESMDQIDVQALRCKTITHNLLRFSRRTQSMIETIDLNQFMEEVIELMEREAKTSGIKFIPDLDTSLPPILSDPSQLQQVFLNLINNAIHAHEGKSYGTIRITTRIDENKKGIQITFADTGSGISQENIEKIFDPFFTTKEVGKGTGLGLSICYTIIKKLGGDIMVKSKIDEGTEFTLFLPFDLPTELKESMTDGT